MIAPAESNRYSEIAPHASSASSERSVRITTVVPGSPAARAAVQADPESAAAYYYLAYTVNKIANPTRPTIRASTAH